MYNTLYIFNYLDVIGENFNNLVLYTFNYLDVIGKIFIFNNLVIIDQILIQYICSILGVVITLTLTLTLTFTILIYYANWHIQLAQILHTNTSPSGADGFKHIPGQSVKPKADIHVTEVDEDMRRMGTKWPSIDILQPYKPKGGKTPITDQTYISNS